jgi:hypothetical protein
VVAIDGSHHPSLRHPVPDMVAIIGWLAGWAVAQALFVASMILIDRFTDI